MMDDNLHVIPPSNNKTSLPFRKQAIFKIIFQNLNIFSTYFQSLQM